MATDSFTNSNNVALTTHNAAWVFCNNYDYGRIYNNGASFSQWSDGSYYRSDSNGNESQIVLLGGETEQFAKCSPAVRMSASNSGYYCEFYGSGANYTDLNLRKNGAWAAWDAGMTYSKSVNHTLKIVASGTSPVTISIYVDGNLELSYEDSSSPYGSGYSGIFFSGKQNNDYAFADDWTDNAVVAGQPVSKRLGGILFASQSSQSSYRW